MLIKTGKDSAVKLPAWLVLVGLMVVDNIYSNHCKKKVTEKLVDANYDLSEVEEEES